MANKKVETTGKVAFGKKKKGKAVKSNNKHDSKSKPNRGQGK